MASNVMDSIMDGLTSPEPNQISGQFQQAFIAAISQIGEGGASNGLTADGIKKFLIDHIQSTPYNKDISLPGTLIPILVDAAVIAFALTIQDTNDSVRSYIFKHLVSQSKSNTQFKLGSFSDCLTKPYSEIQGVNEYNAIADLLTQGNSVDFGNIQTSEDFGIDIISDYNKSNASELAEPVEQAVDNANEESTAESIVNDTGNGSEEKTNRVDKSEPPTENLDQTAILNTVNTSLNECQTQYNTIVTSINEIKKALPSLQSAISNFDQASAKTLIIKASDLNRQLIEAINRFKIEYHNLSGNYQNIEPKTQSMTDQYNAYTVIFNKVPTFEQTYHTNKTEIDNADVSITKMASALNGKITEIASRVDKLNPSEPNFQADKDKALTDIKDLTDLVANLTIESEKVTLAEKLAQLANKIPDSPLIQADASIENNTDHNSNIIPKYTELGNPSSIIIPSDSGKTEFSWSSKVNPMNNSGPAVGFSENTQLTNDSIPSGLNEPEDKAEPNIPEPAEIPETVQDEEEQVAARTRSPIKFTLPSGFGQPVSTAVWNTPVITDFGYPFLNFSSEAFTHLFKTKDEDDRKRTFKKIKKMLKEAKKRYGGIWKAIYGSSLELLKKYAADPGKICVPNYLKVDSDILDDSDSATVTVTGIKYYSVDPSYEKTVEVPREFLESFYDVLDYTKAFKTYVKFADGLTAQELADDMADNGGRSQFYLLVPKQAKYSRSDVKSGTLFSALFGGVKCVMLKTVFRGKRGCFIIDKKASLSLFSDIN